MKKSLAILGLVLTLALAGAVAPVWAAAANTDDTVNVNVSVTANGEIVLGSDGAWDVTLDPVQNGSTWDFQASNLGTANQANTIGVNANGAVTISVSGGNLLSGLTLSGTQAITYTFTEVTSATNPTTVDYIVANGDTTLFSTTANQATNGKAYYLSNLVITGIPNITDIVSGTDALTGTLTVTLSPGVSG